jgi:hypothetical protein
MSPSGAMPTWVNDFASQIGVTESSSEFRSDSEEASTANPWLGLQALQLPACSQDDDQWSDWNWFAKDIVSPPIEASHEEATWPAKPMPTEAYPRLPIFDKLKRESTPRRTQVDPVASPIALSTRFKTPGRGIPGISDIVQREPAPLSAPRTMPRTVSRGTGRKMIIMSEKRAFKLMVKCVEASAKKKIVASGRKDRHVKNVTTGLYATPLESRNTSIGETPSAYRKRSFLSKLQALNVSESFQDKELSEIEDSVDIAVGTREGRSEFKHGMASGACTHGRRESAGVSSLRPVAGGFEAFMAELHNSVNSSGFHSSPRLFHGSTRKTYSSDTSDSSSITDDEHPASVASAVARPAFGNMSTTTNDKAPVRSLRNRNPRSVVPRKLERDELLSRLFPTYTAGNTAQTSYLEIDNVSSDMCERENYCADSQKIDKVSVSDKSAITATLALEGKTYEKARAESSPTVVIKGLVGQHEQMKRSLAVRNIMLI